MSSLMLLMSLTLEGFNTVPGGATVCVAFHYTPKFHNFSWCYSLKFDMRNLKFQIQLSVQDCC